MSRTFRSLSSAREYPNGPRTTFVPGIGEVPRGPRHWLEYRGPGSDRPRPYSPARIRIKQEDSDGESSMFIPAITNEALEEGEISNTVKREDTSPRSGLVELEIEYQNIFSSLLASQSRSTRSDTTGALRQDTSEGRFPRSEISASSRERERSRSPHGSRNSANTLFRDHSGSPMFYRNSRNDSQESRSASADPGANDRRPSELSSEQSTASEEPSSSEFLSVSADSQSSPPPAETEEIEDPRCRCPVGYFCAIRTTNCLDCRPLVREYEDWTQRRDEEAFERHREYTSRGAKFVSDADLVKIINRINHFVTAATQPGRDAAVSAIKAWVIEMADVTITAGNQQNIINQQVLPSLKNFLDPANAPTRRAKNFPALIEEELTVLERKWGRGDFDGDPLRGLLTVEVLDVNGNLRYTRYQANPNWPFYVSAKYFGAGDLVNGQIWESRVQLQRDGVHAPPIAGISGTTREGARSVVLGSFDEKHNLGYADIDMGEVIEYVGTALKDQEGLGPTNIKDPHMSIPDAWNRDTPAKRTAATNAMFRSLETKEPVRVIRSFQMCDIVTNKPSKGYRYDGLYRVVRATALKEARQIWSFRMVREPDQLPAHGPLRGFAGGLRRRDASGQRIGHFTAR